MLSSNSSHRTYCIAVVTRDELNFSRLKELTSISFVVFPLFEQYCTYTRSLYCSRHILILNRRTGVKNNSSIVLVELRDNRHSWNIILQNWLCSYNLSDNLAVCFVDIKSFVVSEEVKSFNELNVSSCWWHPVILNYIASELSCNFCKALKTDVNYLWLV